MGRLDGARATLNLAEVEAVIVFNQPRLAASASADGIVIEGTFLVHERPGAVSPGGPLTAYEIRVTLKEDFPESEPVVFETAGRIPPTADRHVYPDAGNCCITVWEHWLATATDRSFAAYMNGPFRQYFLSQFVFETTGKWPLGEHAHGLPGLEEAYLHALGINDLNKLVPYLKNLSHSSPKGHWKCPCGSGKRLRNCHREGLTALRARIPPALAERMLAKLMHFYTHKPNEESTPTAPNRH